MTRRPDSFNAASAASEPVPVNLSRRHFLLTSAGVMAGALVIGFGLPVGNARAATPVPAGAKPGTWVPAFLEIRPDNTVRLQSPFMEGGQGIYTAMAQIVGEELDADPATFTVESAPAGEQYKVMDIGKRITGGSMSVRMSYTTMRRLGAAARALLLEAAAQRLAVPVTSLTTGPGKVVHADSGRSLNYGELAATALDLPMPDPATLVLKDPAQFRWIGKAVPRLDIHAKSTGEAIFSIDCKVDNMLQAAVQHAPRLGQTVGAITNQSQVMQMPGVLSVHRLPGAVAVVAERWWHAKRAVEALVVTWKEADASATQRVMPADFDTEAYIKHLSAQTGKGEEAETAGDIDKAFANGAYKTVSAVYHSQYVHHAQLEPPSALARFNDDGTLELWMPNQAPEMYQADIAQRFGLDVQKIIIHSPLLGGFFGRHFLYDAANVYPQAIQLAKEVGRPVKVIWSREEEFLRDPLRPMAAVHFRGALDEHGIPVAIEAVSACEGPAEGIANKRSGKLDPSALEGLTGKAYSIANRRIAQLYVKTPMMLGYWRSVGNSMNDFLYETFLDELAAAGKQDPYALRRHLLQDNARLTHLLEAVVELAGGWKPGPFVAADGTKRARGIAMASPFGSEAAAIAEVSIENGQVRVHDIWQAIDPGSIVNPGIIEAQVTGASTLGLSQVLLEQSVYRQGKPIARNYDLYPVLPPAMRARVHVKIIESGAKMGGIGEPPLPAVPPAVANAVSLLTGQRIRSMPLSRYNFTQA